MHDEVSYHASQTCTLKNKKAETIKNPQLLGKTARLRVIVSAENRATISTTAVQAQHIGVMILWAFNSTDILPPKRRCCERNGDIG